jgi:hypothetical protein
VKEDAVQTAEDVVSGDPKRTAWGLTKICSAVCTLGMGSVARESVVAGSRAAGRKAAKKANSCFEA